MLPITIIRPIDGANGRNWPGVVVINPAARYPAAVWAQEAFEAEYRLNPVNWWRVSTSKTAWQDMQILSHEIETLAAVAVYGVSATSYRLTEASAMHRGYGGRLAHLTPEFIAARMSDVSPQAARWVSRNLDRIKRYTEVR